MRLSEYQELASRTCVELPFEEHLLHMQLGMLTELGELLDVFKKDLAYSKDIDIINVGEEIGDYMWYVANDANIYKLNLDSLKLREITFKSKQEALKTLIQLNNLVSSGDYEEGFDISVMRGLAKFFGLGFEKLLENNINKLKVRYKEKFTSTEAGNRNLTAERVELEK